MKRTATWLPRVLGIGYAAFLSLFALDVFSEGYGFGETLLALFIHLIPTLLVVVCLLVAWRHQRLGGWLFISLGIVYGVVFTRADLTGLLIIAVPLVLIGLLFHWAEALRGGPRVRV